MNKCFKTLVVSGLLMVSMGAFAGDLSCPTDSGDISSIQSSGKYQGLTATYIGSGTLPPNIQWQYAQIKDDTLLCRYHGSTAHSVFFIEIDLPAAPKPDHSSDWSPGRPASTCGTSPDNCSVNY